MDILGLKSSFLMSSSTFPTHKLHEKPTRRTSTKIKICCCLKPDPYSARNPKYLDRPKPRSKNPKNPLSDDNARRIIKAKAQYLSALRKNQGSRALTPKWIKRTPEQMVRYLEDDRNGHLYGRHVVAAIKRVRSLSEMAEGSYNMREVMGSFVAKLSNREMCVVLKEQKNWRQVKDFFGWMKLQLSYHPSVIVYTLVLRAYGQVGKIKLAEETFLAMLEEGCEPDEVACGTMLCSYARWGRHKSMLSFYLAVQERGIALSPSVFNFMLSSLQKKSRHRDVSYMWKQMVEKRVAPSQFTYTVVINSLVKQGNSDEAIETYKQMKKLGFVPEESTYSLLICLKCKNGNKDEALHLYEDMRSKGIIPSNFTCASLLSLYYRNGDYTKACSLLNEMKKLGVIADEVIFGLLIRIYGKLGLYDDAQKTFEEIKRSGQLRDEKTYTTMAQVHLRFGNFNKSIDIMEQMKTKNIPYSRFSYAVLLQCFIVKGNLISAEATYQSLSNTGPPDATSCDQMLKFYLRLGLTDKVKDFIARIRKEQIKFDEELFKTVMNIYCREGMLREVLELIEELRLGRTLEESTFVQTFFLSANGQFRTSTESKHFETLDESDSKAIELVLRLCLAAKNKDAMVDRLKFLLKTKVGESVANQLINQFSVEGDLLKAEYLYELMIELGCIVENTTQGIMIGLYGKQKKLKQAQDVFAAATGTGATTNTPYGSMVDAYISCEREQEAYLFYREQIERGHHLNPVSFSLLVKGLANRGQYKQAEDVIRSAFHNLVELDTIACNTFIKAMLDAGKLRFAVSIYERMLSLNISPSIQTFNTMISVYGRGRNLDKAEEMFKTADSMGLGLDEKAYTNLIFYFGKAGKRLEATALFSKMQEEGIQPGQMSCNIIFNIYAAEGLHQEAEQLLQSMKRRGIEPNSLTYLALIRAYTNGSKYSEAEKVIMLMQNEGIHPTCAHFNPLLLAFTKSGLMAEAERTYGQLTCVGLLPEPECKRIMLRGYLKFGHVEKGITFFETDCCNEKPDRLILSAAVHLYQSADRESQAQEIIKSMNRFGVVFLKNLDVGSKLSTP